MENLIVIILIAIATPVGMIVGYWGRKQIAAKAIDSAEAKAEVILNEAKAKQKELLLQAKDRGLDIIEKAKKEEGDRRQELTNLQRRLENRETRFDQKLLELENTQQRLRQKGIELEKAKQEIDGVRQKEIDKLEKIAALSREEAVKLLLERIEQEMKNNLVQRIKKLEATNLEEIEKTGKKLLSTVIQRYASSHVAETTTTTVGLPNDEMKGRIIGKEGRNIKAIEQLTGVEIVVDDTPGEILISGFSPVRRHLAKRVLDKLISDGRIHPARIESTVEEVKKDLATDIRKSGEDALYEVGIMGIDPKLVQILGRLKFRTSYGQNVLLHSIEVAHLAGMLANELGANVTVAKKGGLLHDIGKAIDHEVQGGHPEIGYDLMKKFGLPEEVAYMAIAHHEDQPKTIEGIVVKVADSISGSRPGARKDTLEQYIQRLTELEQLASSFEGVERTYAIQAGREIRVFVHPKTIDDLAAHRLAKNIANRIEEELRYPGEIKVNVIRETRITEYAR